MPIPCCLYSFVQVGGQAVLGRQSLVSTPWLTERHGYDPTSDESAQIVGTGIACADSVLFVQLCT
ncbi:hypothetical protein RYX45_25765, partial [Alkalihalophilus pseudofirmus]